MHDRSACLLLRIPHIESTTLDHEVVDHAMKNRAVVVFVFHVLQKVFDGLGRLVRIKLDNEVADSGRKTYPWRVLRMNRWHKASHRNEHGREHATRQRLAEQIHETFPFEGLGWRVAASRWCHLRGAASGVIGPGNGALRLDAG